MFNKVITLRTLSPSEGDDWRIEIDIEPLAGIRKERIGEGLTQYALIIRKFRHAVRSEVIGGKWVYIKSIRNYRIPRLYYLFLFVGEELLMIS